MGQSGPFAPAGTLALAPGGVVDRSHRRSSRQPADRQAGNRQPADRQDSVPRVRFRFEIALACELLEGDANHLEAIAEEFAIYLERRDEQIGLLAARDWALLVDEVAVRPLRAGDDGIVDVRLSRRPTS